MQDFFGWPMGLEPTTLGTTNRYSNQLNYGHHEIKAANIPFFIISASKE